MGILEVTQSDIDGVPAFWVDSGRPTLTATLMFRVGLVDQSPTTTGFLHLLEHVVLQGSERHGLDIDGAVEPTLTCFHVEGAPEDVVAHLRTVTSRLRELPETDLDHERGVLLAEEREEGASPLDVGLLWRFGVRGPGAVGLGNFAMHAATIDRLQRLSNDWFTRGNAAIALSGRPPAGLALALPEGDARRLGPVPPMRTRQGCYVHEAEGLVLQGLARRSPSVNLAHELLDQRLLAALRHREGLVYSTRSDSEIVAADTVLFWAGAEVGTPNAPRAAGLVLSTIEELASSGATADELAASRATLLRDASDPFLAYSWARTAASAHLQRGVRRGPREIVADSETVTPETVASVFRDIVDTTIIGVPDEETRAVVPLPHLDEPTAPVPERVAATYRALVPLPGSAVVRSYQGGVHVTAAGQGTLIPFSEVVACHATPHGTRRLLREDGTAIALPTAVFHHGSELRDLLDRSLDPILVVPAPDDPGDEEPMPTRGELGRDIASVVGWFTLAVLIFGGLTVYRLRPDLVSLQTLLVILAVSTVLLGASGVRWLMKRSGRRAEATAD